jgi:dipeptidase
MERGRDRIMCDTMAARAGATTTGGTLFAKNSDRERNEAQYLEILPARSYGAGAVVRCTYIPIPQAPRTHAVLLSRPFWIWGAEMGANEHGVVIGNEAVHPRLQPQRQRALIGMDLLRLGLERGATAAEAVEVICTLLERHGQGGSCGHLGTRFYDNSFIVADRSEVFVVETMGRHWAVEHAAERRAISNTYTIGRPDRMSDGFEAFIRAQGWWTANRLDLAAAVTNPDNPGLAGALARCGRSTARLAGKKLDTAMMMAALRDHGTDADAADFHPQAIEGATVCMHARDARRGGQSVGSLVSDLRPQGALHWVTGTSAPCLSVFKPVFLDDGLPDQGATPGDRFDAATLWWRHERLHRGLLASGPEAMAGFAAERDAQEAAFRARVEPLIGAPGPTRHKEVAACWREATALEDRWIARLRGAAPLHPGYRAAWQRHDRLAGAPLLCAPAALAAE